jgi:flagellar motor component MotA
MKRTLITALIASSIIGFASLFVQNAGFTIFYVITSALILAVAGVGGILVETQDAVRDIRDIYRERSKLQNEKIAKLKENIIEQQKEILRLRGEQTVRTAAKTKK